MSIFNAAARRSVGLESRIEDTAIIYNSDPFTFLFHNEYKGFEYFCMLSPHMNYKGEICNCPTVYIQIVNYKFINKKLSSNNSPELFLKNRNGDPTFIEKSHILEASNYIRYIFFHPYNEETDLNLNNKDRHRYTLNELELDCKAFIDNIFEIDKEL